MSQERGTKERFATFLSQASRVLSTLYFSTRRHSTSFCCPFTSMFEPKAWHASDKQDWSGCLATTLARLDHCVFSLWEYFIARVFLDLRNTSAELKSKIMTGTASIGQDMSQKFRNKHNSICFYNFARMEVIWFFFKLSKNCLLCHCTEILNLWAREVFQNL